MSTESMMISTETTMMMSTETTMMVSAETAVMVSAETSVRVSTETAVRVSTETTVMVMMMVSSTQQASNDPQDIPALSSALGHCKQGQHQNNHQTNNDQTAAHFYCWRRVGTGELILLLESCKNCNYNQTVIWLLFI